MYEQLASLRDLRHIRKMMEQSSRFLGLSGYSGLAAGCIALAGAWLASQSMQAYTRYRTTSLAELKEQLLLYASVVLFSAVVVSFIFTYLQSRKAGVALLGSSGRRLLSGLGIPFAVGGILCLRLLQLDQFSLLVPVCLLCYGLALVNASKYTLPEIGYLGLCELILGLLSLWYPARGLQFWAAGFGVLHILYGCVMWWRHDRP